MSGHGFGLSWLVKGFGMLTLIGIIISILNPISSALGASQKEPQQSIDMAFLSPGRFGGQIVAVRNGKRHPWMPVAGRLGKHSFKNPVPEIGQQHRGMET